MPKPKKHKPKKSDRQREIEAFEAECRTAHKKRQGQSGLRKRYRDDPDLREKMRRALVEDLQRVFNSPLNPYKGYAASRARYRNLGYYPEVMVEDFFGNHQEFQRAAELHDKRTTTKVKNLGAVLHTHQQIANYADSCVLPAVGRYDKTDKHKRRESVEVVIGSDFHSSFLDPFAFRVFLDTIRMVDPAIVVLNGDVVDFPQISRHRKLPGHFHLNIAQERDFAVDLIMRKVREAAPEATVYFVIGNHEYRLVNYLADCSPQMADLPELRFDKLFKLDELEISLVCRSNFLAPSAAQRKKDIRENWVHILDSYIATHGTSISRHPADAELRRFAISGTSGHVHRPQIHSSNTLGTGPLTWMSTPMMASFAVGKDYVTNPSAWQMGFGVVSISPGRKLASPTLVIVHEEWASFGGKDWTPTAKEREIRKKMLMP